MKRFTIKFLILTLVLLIPAGYFRFFVINNESGDIGKLGMIPFGVEYEGLGVTWYERDSSLCGKVIDIYDRDSLKAFPVITIGDSFSQFRENGYQHILSARLSTPVANFKRPDSLTAPTCFMALLHDDCFLAGQTVIVENVERSLIWNYSTVDTLKAFENVAIVSPAIVENKSEPFLNEYFSWIRMNMHYKNPITCFRLAKDCFTHTKFSNTLYVYNSVQLGDGDLLWKNLSEDRIEKAVKNMERMIEISKEKGINLIILIATDKYDAYSPWILDEHLDNPILDRIPQEAQFFDCRPVLREAIGAGIKDIYKLNNTHWSIVGADIIGDSLFESMIQNDLLPKSTDHGPYFQTLQ